MKEYTQIEQAPCDTAVALGFFDGLHRGHQAVIRSAAQQRKYGLQPAVFTFSENPLNVLTGKKVPYLLQPNEKVNLMNRLSVEFLYSIEFKEIMHLSPAEFVTNVLVEKLRAKKVFCGFNYHFGSGRHANADTLRELCEPFGVEVITVPPVLFKDEPMSSTRIRHALKQGKITDVTSMLGREFSFNLPVHKGNQLGRRMGTPTFNQPFPPHFILPRFGVYASAVDIGGTLTCGVTNIGIKPTVGAEGPLAETWMPHQQCGELYGKNVRVFLLDFIRGEQKFDSLFELKAAILADGENAIKIFDEKGFA